MTFMPLIWRPVKSHTVRVTLMHLAHLTFPVATSTPDSFAMIYHALLLHGWNPPPRSSQLLQLPALIPPACRTREEKKTSKRGSFMSQHTSLTATPPLLPGDRSASSPHVWDLTTWEKRNLSFLGLKGKHQRGWTFIKVRQCVFLVMKKTHPARHHP